MKYASAGFIVTAAGIVSLGATPHAAHATPSATSCAVPAGQVGAPGPPGPPPSPAPAPAPGPGGPSRAPLDMVPAQPCSEFPLLCFEFAPGIPGPVGPPGTLGTPSPPPGADRRVHAAAPALPCEGSPADCIIQVDGVPGPAGPPGLICGPQRVEHVVHRARPAVDVVFADGRAIAYVTPAVAGGSVINVPAECLEIPLTGTDVGGLTTAAVAVTVAGLAAVEVSRKRRRFRFRR